LGTHHQHKHLGPLKWGGGHWNGLPLIGMDRGLLECTGGNWNGHAPSTCIQALIFVTTFFRKSNQIHALLTPMTKHASKTIEVELLGHKLRVETAVMQSQLDLIYPVLVYPVLRTLESCICARQKHNKQTTITITNTASKQTQTTHNTTRNNNKQAQTHQSNKFLLLSQGCCQSDGVSCVWVLLTGWDMGVRSKATRI